VFRRRRTQVKDGVAGTVVAITGGARGIGLAIADAFVHAGAKVVIGDLDTELAQTASTRCGAAVYGVHLDVTDPASFAALFNSAEMHFGPVEILINNAGIMPTGEFLDETPEMTDRIININLHGVITGCRLAGLHMRDRGSGIIINVASMAGLFGAPSIATYCATNLVSSG
jgi:NAD(P)-dependent dehydrogenase (short-subunit alcohol dehydrogenase family)